jgi:hypothetical protein
MVEVDGVSCIHTVDVSPEGVRVVSGEPLAVGRNISLHFFTPHSATPVLVNSEVVWCREDDDAFASGIRFCSDAASADTLRELGEYLHHQGKVQSRE